MTDIQSDLERLDEAMRLYIRTMKRPQRWSQIMERANVRLDRPSFHILHALTVPREQGWRLQDLATELGIEAPSVTRKSQELEQAGYLRRTRNPMDKRAIGLQITARGRNLTNRTRQVQLELISEVLAQWPINERKQFIALFERFSTDLANQQHIVKAK